MLLDAVFIFVILCITFSFLFLGIIIAPAFIILTILLIISCVDMIREIIKDWR